MPGRTHTVHHNRCLHFLIRVFVHNQQFDVTDIDIQKNIKLAAALLNYPMHKGIPVNWVDTHSLQSGGANALSLLGYSNQEIQKLGRWHSATFKEYIREELACFSTGMSTSMKTRFNFVIIAGGAYQDVTSEVVEQPYPMSHDN